MKLAIRCGCNPRVQTGDFGSQALYIEVNRTTGRHRVLPFDNTVSRGLSGHPVGASTGRLIAGANRKPESLPILDTGFEAMCTQTARTKQLNGIGCQYAERPAAVGNDFFAARKVGKT